MRKILILSLGLALSLGVQAKDYHRTADTTTVVRRLSADGMLRPLKPSYMKGALVASPWTDNLVCPSGRRNYGLPRQTARMQRPIRSHETGILRVDRQMVHTFRRRSSELWRYAVQRLQQLLAGLPSTFVLISCGMSSATSTRTMYTPLPDGVSFHTWAWVCCTTR
ncbi:hypothetical protein NXW75_16930 [Bacteroides xylanisolvens]|nr:hypothetical protein [Bacteroides xylanisolvens]